MRTKNKTTGFAWVGRWRDGSIGWAMPKCVTGYIQPAERSGAGHGFVRDDDTLVLCEITVKVVKRNGREVRRKARTVRR